MEKPQLISKGNMEEEKEESNKTLSGVDPNDRYNGFIQSLGWKFNLMSKIQLKGS